MKTETISLTMLVLDVEEARWLSALMRRPFGVSAHLPKETPIDKEMRMKFRKALGKV